jgi:hypothetical protein
MRKEGVYTQELVKGILPEYGGGITMEHSANGAANGGVGTLAGSILRGGEGAGRFQEVAVSGKETVEVIVTARFSAEVHPDNLLGRVARGNPGEEQVQPSEGQGFAGHGNAEDNFGFEIIDAAVGFVSVDSGE